MKTPSRSGDLAAFEFALTSEEREQVKIALEDVLSSSPLRSTAQCQHLLRYIVEHTLEGDSVVLRERIIGREVFGRQPDYEPGEDPVVRIRAADLRKRLALYYQALAETPVLKIDVPPEPIGLPSRGPMGRPMKQRSRKTFLFLRFFPRPRFQNFSKTSCHPAHPRKA